MLGAVTGYSGPAAGVAGRSDVRRVRVKVRGRRGRSRLLWALVVGGSALARRGGHPLIIVAILRGLPCEASR